MSFWYSFPQNKHSRNQDYSCFLYRKSIANYCDSSVKIVKKSLNKAEMNLIINQLIYFFFLGEGILNFQTRWRCIRSHEPNIEDVVWEGLGWGRLCGASCREWSILCNNKCSDHSKPNIGTVVKHYWLIILLWLVLAF